MLPPHSLSEDTPPAVGMISLGCAKNLVDAEIMLGSILSRGMRVVSEPSEADVLIVNTCAFIDPAKEESIEAILQAHQERGLAKRPGQKLIVSGCMSQRFSKELASELPEVDAFMGLDQVAQAGEIVERVLAAPSADDPSAPGRAPLDLVTSRPRYIPDYDTPRYRLTPAHTAYLKIAEGCNHPCSFCVIPRMRGRHRSRSVASVVEEARRLVGEGVREINLISQDTTYYGMDLWKQRPGPRTPAGSGDGPSLITLLRELDRIPGDFWIRLLYTHPAHWSRDLMKAIADSEKTARYADMPLQHIHDDMLAAMRRETSRAHIEAIIRDLRALIPGLAIRTTFIVGFPGETDEHFESLLDFIALTRFERLGVFCYSREEGSRAASMPGQIPKQVKNRRYREAMLLQQRIAAEQAASMTGRTIRVLAETPDTGRSEADAPEVDCRVHFTEPVKPGEFVRAFVTGARGYDIEAEPLPARAAKRRASAAA